jgi:hypothetical protein
MLCSYSIPSSARASSVGGISRPTALAVVRLKIESGRLLDRDVARVLPAQNPVGILGGAPIHVEICIGLEINGYLPAEF